MATLITASLTTIEEPLLLRAPDIPLPGEIPPVYRSLPEQITGKNIVVCADGTGNADVKGRGSNVFKLFEAVDTQSFLLNTSLPRQITFYDEGVGTENWWPRRLIGGAFGKGLEEKVCDLYRNIARVYEPGDRLFLFGFSRGAFIVRALADMIECCGIIDGSDESFTTRKELCDSVRDCYKHFLRCGHSPHLPLSDTIACHCHERVATPIEFLGVWDTVDSFGFSFKGLAKWLNARLHFKPTVGLPRRTK